MARLFTNRLLASLAGGLVALVLLSLPLIESPSAAPPGGAPTHLDVAALQQAATDQGSVPVIVGFTITDRRPEGFRPEGLFEQAAERAAQQAAIGEVQDRLLQRTSGLFTANIKRFTHIPFMALWVGPHALDALARMPEVTGIEPDRLIEPVLAQSVPLIGADDAWAAGYTGAGQAVAILDTGVDKFHSFLSGKVTSEACYSTTGDGGSFTATTVCPNGLDTQTGSGSGVNCPTTIYGCSHGTHVAGIAAGSGSTFSGVAKGADVIAVQVFTEISDKNLSDPQADACGSLPDPCAQAFTSDIIDGLERVYALRDTLAIAAVNMSLGGGKYTSEADCDADNPSTKTAIDNLRSVGIATVVASGNNGFTDALSYPACISTAVSVGATTESDTIAYYSNSASFLDLLAPGSSITSSVPNGSFSTWNGTSMATPHVAGAWAVLKEQSPAATVDEILTELTGSGTPILDSRNGITKPRVALDAVTSIAPVQVDTTALAIGTVGEPYSQMLAASGGTAPYTWAVTVGMLPGGLTLDAATGEIYGSPSTAETQDFTVEVTDETGATDTQALSITVTEPAATVFEDDFEDGALDPWQQLQSGTVALVNDSGNWVLRKSGNNDPNGAWAPLAQSIGDFELVLYTRKVNTTGWGALRYSLTDASGNGYGLLLHHDTGDLRLERRDGWAGTVLQSATAVSGGLSIGQWYTLRLLRQGSELTAEAFLGRVDPATATPLQVLSDTDSTYAYFTQVNINGGYEFDTDGVRVTNPTVDQPLAVKTATLPDGAIGEPYSQMLAASGGTAPYTWAVTVGMLPGGLTLDAATGEIYGSPSTAETQDFTVEVTDETGATDTQALSITVTEPAATVFEDDFEDGALDPWQQLQSGTVALVNDSGNWVLRKSGNNDPNGAWAPLAQSIGDFELVLYTRKVNTTGWGALRYSLTDASGNGYGLLLHHDTGDLRLERRDGWAGTVLQSATAVSGGLSIGQWYTLRLLRQGSELTAEAFLGRVDPATATPLQVLSDTDSTYAYFTQVNINGGYEFDTDGVRVTNPTVDQPLAVKTATLPDGAIGEPYSQMLAASGGTAPYTWAVTVGMLPGGLTLDAATGEIYGSPSTAETQDFTVEVTDETGATDTQALSITVTEPAATVFEDDFEDGALDPWQQLQSGTVALVNDSGNWVLRKSGNNDPNGAWAPLAQSIGDFELVLYTRKVNTTGWGALRYSLTDASGNGYGLLLHHDTGDLRLERRDGWAGTVLQSATAVSGGLSIGQWYTLRLLRQGSELTAEAFLGRVDPATATPLQVLSDTDSTYAYFTQVNINGGYEFDTDAVKIR